MHIVQLQREIKTNSLVQTSRTKTSLRSQFVIRMIWLLTVFLCYRFSFRESSKSFQRLVSKLRRNFLEFGVNSIGQYMWQGRCIASRLWQHKRFVLPHLLTGLPRFPNMFHLAQHVPLALCLVEPHEVLIINWHFN